MKIQLIIEITYIFPYFGLISKRPRQPGSLWVDEAWASLRSVNVVAGNAFRFQARKLLLQCKVVKMHQFYF